MPFPFVRFVRLLATCVFAIAFAGLVAGHARAEETGMTAAAFEPIKTALDHLEQAFHKSSPSDETYAELRRQLAPLRDDLRGKIEAVEPELDKVLTRLKEVGDRPANDRPEDPAIGRERKNLTRSRTELDAAQKQGRLLAVRADQFAVAINEERRALFARELFAHTPGLFDPAFWRRNTEAVSDELTSLGDLFRSWWGSVRAKGAPTSIAASLATLAALAAAAFALLRWWRRRFFPDRAKTRFERATAALLLFAAHTVALPIVVLAIVLVLQSNGLMPPRVAEIGFGIAVSVAIATFGRGVAVGLFAPRAPERRLIGCADAQARAFAAHLAWGGGLLGIAVFLNVVHKGVSAPISLTVATSALLALAVGLLALHLVLRFPKVEANDAALRSHSLAWVRVLAWLFVLAVAAALITGYVSFAAFIAARLLVVLALLGALYVALTFVESLFADVLTAETERGRRIAALLGISPRGLELTGILASAFLRIVLVLIAFFLVLGKWGIFAADVFGVLQTAASGIRIGEVTISVTTILTAAAILIIGILVTRAAQRWLEIRFLPRTRLQPGLQHSVSHLFGYALLIAVLSLTLAEIGIDLQKIALVAGALSVGIGFGLQSVVSNFVSGLILLAERPIRVGDWVVVKSEEGLVRRISVRATEIETFDRATVIIPNSELITGVVKNWTHSNTMGRVTVKLGVAYKSDVEQVRDILLACANDHPHVLENPSPRVFLLAFGDSALEFELRCIVANVENALSVKSDLNFAVLQRFRAAGIDIPYPQREVRVVSGEEDESRQVHLSPMRREPALGLRPEGRIASVSESSG